MNWALILAFSLPPRSDPWFGADKAKHFVAAAAVQSLAYSAWRATGASAPAALWRATAVTGAASLAKEWHDKRSGRAFSGRDLVWDAAGAGTASLAIIGLRGR